MTELSELPQPPNRNDECQFMATKEQNFNNDEIFKMSEVLKYEVSEELCGGKVNLNLQQQQSLQDSRRLDCSWMVCCVTTAIILMLLMCIWIVFEINEADV